MKVNHVPKSREEAASSAGAQLVVAASKGGVARAQLFSVAGGDQAPKRWVGHVVLITPPPGESHEVAALVAPVLEDDPGRPWDEYFQILLLRDLFMVHEDDDLLPIHDVWQRLRDASYAVETLVKQRDAWEAVTGHLLAHGVVTESEARAFMVQSQSKMKPA
ncbi:hypothetical protein [Lacipirellula sp.]|uniref:hypothetical protein n=1 Tax=Lacipirellula sp. TaxID=2691419 RepID=UPI003D11440C